MSKSMQIKMNRHGQTPWGFRLHGGADFGTPLIIQKVTPDSPSASAGLQAGDVIASVNGKDVSSCRHKEAQDLIIRAGNNFQLTISRGGLMQQAWKPQVAASGQMPSQPTQGTFTKTSLKANAGWDNTLNANKPGAASNAEDFTKAFMSDMYGGGASPQQQQQQQQPPPQQPPPPQQQQPPQQQHLRPAAPSPSFRTASPSQQSGGFTTVSGTPKTQSYNNPSGLYSDANIKDAIEQQSETLSSGVKGINFNKPDKVQQQQDLANSAVRRALQEEESGRGSSRGVAGMSEFQENRQYAISFADEAPAGQQHHQQQQQLHSGQDPSSNVQSTSFKLLQRALASDDEDATDNSQSRISSAKINSAPSAFKGGDDGAGFRSVRAPITKPGSGASGPPQPQLSTCGACDRLITGVFLKAGGKPLHAECFKCATCSCSLKNIGHFHINNKFYCDNHAAAAKASNVIQQQQPAAPINVSQPQHQPKPQSQPQPQPQNQNWDNTLNANKAGAASNAEDFTKNFMADMFGSGAGAGSDQQQRVLPSKALSASLQKRTPSPARKFVPQTQSGLNLDVNRSSFKAKKGGSMRWPPQQQSQPDAPNPSQTATATPMYIDPANPPQHPQQPQQPQQPPIPVTVPTSNAPKPQQQLQPQSILKPSSSPSKSLAAPSQAASSMQMSSSSSSSYQHQSSSSMVSSSSSNMNQASSAVPPNNNSKNNDKRTEISKPTQKTSLNLSKQITNNRAKAEKSKDESERKCCKCSADLSGGPFITAMGKTWCPNHFACSKDGCGRSLQDVGFVEEKGQLYCEECYGKYLAPDCEKCRKKILGNTLKAMNRTFHPECFVCAYCGKIFANSPFYLEDGLPYCEEDWNELFTTKCVSCGFPIEAGDRWVEALNNNYHSQCFNCTLCKKNLEGMGFFVKAGKAFCKSHARG